MKGKNHFKPAMKPEARWLMPSQSSENQNVKLASVDRRRILF
jgi:hypothetical protein